MAVNVRDVVPGFEAMLLGIDLFELELERFRGETHERLLAKHQQRVQAFEIAKIMRDFDGYLNEVGQMWRKKEEQRRARIRASKQEPRYDFSDEQLQIARRSLSAKDSV
jgi:hypothetical protein